MSLSPATPAPRVRGAFVAYTVVVCAAAAVSVLGLGRPGQWQGATASTAFWLLGLLVIAGELLPIQVPRRHSSDQVTISTAFGFAALVIFGPGPAMVAYGLASVIADTTHRLAPTKVAFNAGQYVLAVGAAAGVLAALGQPDSGVPVGEALPAILLAALAFGLVNHLLAGSGAALLADSSVTGYLRQDLIFQAWTTGVQLTYAPLVVAAADTGLSLLALSFLPMMAIWVGGGHAAANAHRAFHDGLTDLPNRGLFHERLRRALDRARREHHSVVVLSLDLDDFKAVNDTLGHHSGDLLLQQVAARILSAVRETDTVARLGGDEFAVLLDGRRTIGDGEAAAQRILQAFEEPFEVDAVSLDVGASVGVACSPRGQDGEDRLLQHVDVALYQAKQRRSRFEVYAHREEEEEAGLDRLVLAGQLRRGIEAGELELHFQPKVPLAGGRPRGVEALVRWNHPQLGLIGPEGFIELAEHTGLIGPLTDRVLDGALAQAKAWERRGLRLQMAVNISARSLLDRDLPREIQAGLDRFELAPAALQLEITESRIIVDLRRAQSVLAELRELGVSVAIDDFGTGASSLAQLQQLPVDEIKIDRSFVLSMEESLNAATIVSSTVDLGRNLGLRVTAEGVETESVRGRLAELGCDYAQGYLHGRPTPAPECERTLLALSGDEPEEVVGPRLRPDRPRSTELVAQAT